MKDSSNTLSLSSITNSTEKASRGRPPNAEKALIYESENSPKGPRKLRSQRSNDN